MNAPELERQVDRLEIAVRELTEKLDRLMTVNKNKDGLPIGLLIHATVNGVGKVVLEVCETDYVVVEIAGTPITNGREFGSLSSAAEMFSQINRKSGWVFWKGPNGKTLKESYKR